MNTNVDEMLTPQSPIEHHMPLVRRAAGKLYRDLGLATAGVEFGDLLQFGYVGLLEARERFEAGRGTDFRGYAFQRIHGAMFDGLRKMTRLPRRACRLVQAARLQHEIDSIMLEVRGAGSLEDALSSGRLVAACFLVTQGVYVALELNPENPSPEELTHEKRRAERLRMLVDELPELDREVTRRHCFDGQPLARIAKDLGISRPWAWRVLERACRNITFAFAAVPS